MLWFFFFPIAGLAWYLVHHYRFWKSERSDECKTFGAYIGDYYWFVIPPIMAMFLIILGGCVLGLIVGNLTPNFMAVETYATEKYQLRPVPQNADIYGTFYICFRYGGKERICYFYYLKPNGEVSYQEFKASDCRIFEDSSKEITVEVKKRRIVNAYSRLWGFVWCWGEYYEFHIPKGTLGPEADPPLEPSADGVGQIKVYEFTHQLVGFCLLDIIY